MTEEPFLGGESAFFGHGGSFSDESHVGDVVAEHRGVRGHGLSAGSADEHVDGFAEPFSFEVPEGVVDCRDRHHGFALSTMHGGAVHDVP